MLESFCSCLRKLAGAARRCTRDERGVSALEFALVAPVLVFAVLWTADLGLAFTERMAIDHALRAGAQVAMADQGAAKVGLVVQATAQENFQVATAPATGTASAATTASATETAQQDTSRVLALDAPRRFCACPESSGVEVACTTKTCAGAAPPLAFYELGARRTYDGLLQNFSLNQSVRVQVR